MARLSAFRSLACFRHLWVAIHAMTKRVKWMILSGPVVVSIALRVFGLGHGYYSQDEGQEYIRCDLNAADGIDFWLALFGPEIELVTRHETPDLEHHRLPPPKPAIAN